MNTIKKAKAYRKFAKTHKGQKLKGYRTAKIKAPIRSMNDMTEAINKSKDFVLNPKKKINILH